MQWIAGLCAVKPNNMPNAKQASYIGRVEKVLSTERLSKFKLAASEPRWEALARYAWNVAVSEAFYPLLHAFEVVLRNQVYAAGHAAYPAKASQDIHCWLDAVPSPLHPKYGISGVANAKQKLFGNRAGAAAPLPARGFTPGDLVAALDFGFWTGMFSSYYAWRSPRDPRLWPQRLNTVFPHGPKLTRVQAISGPLNEIRHLRNRIFHHEPIWKRPNLTADRQKILEMLGWMSPETAQTVQVLDRLPEVLSAGFQRQLRVRIYRESRD
jgi:hypothetical protein